MLAAVAIFVSGAAFSIYQGIETIVGGEESTMLWINYPVLVLAAVLEGISLRQAAKQMRGETTRLRLTLGAVPAHAARPHRQQRAARGQRRHHRPDHRRRSASGCTS